MGTDKEKIMLILESHSYYARLLEFDHKSCQYKEVSRDSVKLNAQELKVHGAYEFLDNKLVAIYVSNGIMLLRISKDIIPVNDIISFEFNSKGINSTIYIRYNDSVLSLKYKNSTDQMIEDDFTPFVEKEHFDFGLYIKNLISDKGRKIRLLDIWGS